MNPINQTRSLEQSLPSENSGATSGIESIINAIAQSKIPGSIGVHPDLPPLRRCAHQEVRTECNYAWRMNTQIAQGQLLGESEGKSARRVLEKFVQTYCF